MMIEINFMFQGKDNVIKSSTTRLFKDVCEEFAKKVNVDLDCIIFIHNGLKINLEMDYYVGQQFNLDFEFGNKRVDILVYQENPFSVVFNYQGIDYVISAKETEKMKDIFERFAKKTNINLVNVFLLYAGNNLSDEEGKEKTLSQVINKDDRTRKAMNILVNDFERNSINSEDNIKIYSPILPNDDNDNNPSVPLINQVDNIDNDNNSISQSINEVQEGNREGNSRNENSNCFFNILDKLRPVYIILIQIGIIILFVGVGCFLDWHKYLKNNEIFLKVIATVFFGICAIMSLILVIFYRFLKREFESKCWYLYYIYYIPLVAIINYIIASILNPNNVDYKMLLVYLFIRAFALVPVIILKGSNLKLFCLLILISNAIIIVPLAILWIKQSNVTFLLSFFSFFYDIYLCFVYHYSGGLFSLYDAKLSVLMYDFGFFALIVYCFMLILYPLYWLSKKCIEFFKND